MKLQDLKTLSVGIINTKGTITVGTGNKITINTRTVKETLKYEEGDLFYIDKLLRDGETYDVIACIPEIEGVKTFAFNKGTFSFGDKVLAETLGGQGSEWDISAEFDVLELEDGRKCPLMIIEQKVDGKKKQKELQERYDNSVVKKASTIPTSEVIVKEPVQAVVNEPEEVVIPTEAQIREQEFEAEAPEVFPESTTVNNFGL